MAMGKQSFVLNKVFISAVDLGLLKCLPVTLFPS